MSNTSRRFYCHLVMPPTVTSQCDQPSQVTSPSFCTTENERVYMCFRKSSTFHFASAIIALDLVQSPYLRASAQFCPNLSQKIFKTQGCISLSTMQKGSVRILGPVSQKVRKGQEFPKVFGKIQGASASIPGTATKLFVEFSASTTPLRAHQEFVALLPNPISRPRHLLSLRPCQ
jgi:hypothetical protein